MTDLEPLRIVHIVRSPIGGIFRHICDLARAQAAAGHSVGLVCDSLTGGAFEAGKVADLSGSLALGSVRIPIARQIAPSDAASLAKVRSVLAPLAPDIVHAHGAKGGVFGRVVAAWLGRSRPVARFYAPHGGSLHYAKNSMEGRLYFRVERLLERVTDALIHVSDYERRAYLEKVGAPHCPAVVVRNGLVPEEFELLDAKGDASDFVYLGMLRDLKGVDVLLEATALLADQGRPVTVSLAGDGPHEARYREFVERRGLGALVRFVGQWPTRQSLAMGRALVLPSRAESMPYVALEAIAAGMPIIATRVGGVPEIFGPHSGELIPADDASALASAMASVVADPAAAKAGAARLRSHISDEFSLKVMSSRIESIYRDGISRRRSRV